MRASRYTIFMYGAIIGVPLLMMLTVTGLLENNPYAYSALPALLGIAASVFVVTGFFETFAHGRYEGSGNRLEDGEEKSVYVCIPLDLRHE